MSTRFIILGASGVIGGALWRAARNRGLDTIATTKQRTGQGLVSFDLHTDGLASLVPDLGPQDHVFIMAANISAAWIEEHQDEAAQLNVAATLRIADEALAAGAHVIFPSTDQIFNGMVGGYTEEDKVEPLSAYGRMKAEVETALHDRGGRSTVIRTGWNIPRDIESHCPITDAYRNMLQRTACLATDNIISITDVEDTASALCTIAQLSEPPRVCHVTSHPGIARSKIGDLIIANSSRASAMNVSPIRFASLPTARQRPRLAWLKNDLAVRLGCSFAAPEIVIVHKIALLDAHPVLKGNVA